MGAKARRLRQPHIVLLSHSQGREGGVSTLCQSLEDMRDYCQPQAPGGGRASPAGTPACGGLSSMCVCVCVTGALLKAVCVCSGLVSLSSSQSLKDQLMEQWGGGLELHSWSLLPTGSGLGEITAPHLHPLHPCHMALDPFFGCRYQQHPGGGAVGRRVQVHRSNLRHGLPHPRCAPPGAGLHHR